MEEQLIDIPIQWSEVTRDEFTAATVGTTQEAEGYGTTQGPERIHHAATYHYKDRKNPLGRSFWSNTECRFVYCLPNGSC